MLIFSENRLQISIPWQNLKQLSAADPPFLLGQFQAGSSVTFSFPVTLIYGL